MPRGTSGGGRGAAGFEAEVAGGGWGGYLLPPEDPAATRQEAEMLAEVRAILASPAFALALQVPPPTPPPITRLRGIS